MSLKKSNKTRSKEKALSAAKAVKDNWVYNSCHEDDETILIKQHQAYLNSSKNSSSYTYVQQPISVDEVIEDMSWFRSFIFHPIIIATTSIFLIMIIL